jgi:trk system potassium uptake protein TrkA
MNAIVVGCGRVGAALARTLADAGWEVVAVDESEDALERLGENWRQRFVVGPGIDMDVLEEAGIAETDCLVASTDGDNTNIVVAQVARLRYDVPRVAARIHDPARAEFYRGRGIEIVSPAQFAIGALVDWTLENAEPR